MIDEYDTPEWKARRAQILERDNYTCQSCGSKRNLRVHHLVYPPRGIPKWESPDEHLDTLCSDCHEKAQKLVIESRSFYKKNKHSNNDTQRSDFKMTQIRLAVLTALDQLGGTAHVNEIGRQLATQGQPAGQSDNVKHLRNGGFVKWVRKGVYQLVDEKRSEWEHLQDARNLATPKKEVCVKFKCPACGASLTAHKEEIPF